MEAALIIILLVIANLALYWVFYGKKKFDGKINEKEVKTINLKSLKK